MSTDIGETQSRAYVSYLSNDLDYKGVLVNNYCLRKHGSKYPYICICCTGVSAEVIDTLRIHGINTVSVDLEDMMNKYGINAEFRNYMISKHTFGKFTMFLIPGYDRCVYLDADFLILENIDSLFDTPIKDCAMVWDCVMSPPDKICYTKNTYNSGCVVYKPTQRIFDLFMEVAVKFQTLDYNKYVRTDQEFFNYMVLKEMIDIIPLQPKYNCYPYAVDILSKTNPVAIVHFIGRPKPWDFMNPLNRTIKKYEIEKARDYYFIWMATYTEMCGKFFMQPQTSYLLADDCRLVLTEVPQENIQLTYVQPSPMRLVGEITIE